MEEGDGGSGMRKDDERREEGGRREGGREEAPGCGSLDIPASPICQGCGPLLLSQGSFGNCVC